MKRIEKIGLAVGLLLLGYLIYKSGPALLVAHLRRVGWGVFLLLAIAATRSVFRASAIRLAMGEERQRFSLSAMYIVLLASEAIKFVAFAGYFLGESAKAVLLSRRVAATRAVSSVVLDVLLYNVSAAMFLLLGVAVLFSRVEVGLTLRRAVLAGTGVLTVGVFLVLLGFVRRWLTGERILRGLARIAPRRALREWTERHRAQIIEADAQVFDFHGRHTAAFYAILLLDLAAHAIAALEVYAVIRLLGLPLGYLDAVAIEGVRKLVSLAGTVVPANLGLYEGGTALVLLSFGMPLAAGVAIEIARKLRAILWAGLGFLALLFTAQRKDPRRNQIPVDRG